MVGDFKEEKTPYKIMTLAVLAVMFFLLCRMIYAGLIALPYPKSSQDAGNIALTRMFIDKISPYSSDSLERFIPGINYSQPFINSYLAALLAKIFGLAPVNSHFVISLFSILFSGYLGYMIMGRYVSAPTCIPLLTALVFMLCHWKSGFISSTPFDLGLFLFVLTVYVSTEERVRYKPMWCSVIVTLCFYTVPWATIAIIPALVYMIVFNRKEALWFGLWTVCINALIVWFITAHWPLYWVRVFVIPFFGLYHGRMIEVIVHSVPYIVRMLAMLSAVGFFTLTEKIRSEDREWLNIGIKTMAILIVAFTGLLLLPQHVLSSDELDNWKRAYENTRVYRSRGQVYFAECLVYDQSFDFNDDNGDCLCSDDEIVNEETLDSVMNSGVSEKQIELVRQITEQNLDYRRSLEELTRNRNYSLITLDDGYSVFDEAMLKNYGYEKIDSIVLRIGTEPCEVAFYALN